MRELERFRRMRRDQTRKDVGMGRGDPLLWHADLGSAQSSPEVVKLPESADAGSIIQTAGGLFYYSVDHSIVDGPAPIG